jgi:NAD(P)H-dependent FMN reductase
MTETAGNASGIRTVSSPEQLTGASLLGVCTSLKPAVGVEASSATRSYLNYSLEVVGSIYPDTYLLDLRDHPLPSFDGRMPHEYGSAELEFVHSCIERSGALLLSIPAYWSGVSGVFKNFVDTLCGPAYDLEERQTVFTNKPVGLLIVGADLASTEAGVAQAQQILSSTGAVIVAEPVAINNPRAGKLNAQSVSNQLALLGAQLAQHAIRAKKT